ncbi:MAG: DUF3237 domain-containing protein [Pseudomonadales bacterium]
MKLIPLMELQGRIVSNTDVGNTPLGRRGIAQLSGGSFSGERLSGQILSPAADWLLIDQSGYGQVDVRMTLATVDGAHIYMRYTGVLEFNDKVNQAFASEASTDFGDSYFVTQPRFETGDQRYGWLNHVVAVAEGRLLEGGVQYRIYECQPGE